jgi:hypothetical protein
MAQLPRDVPFIDLLVPAGSEEAVSTIQTRMDLVGGGGWSLIIDDGTMETSSLPMGPLRGDADRVWAYRSRPWTPGEALHDAASLTMELAVTLQARVAALGVHGTYAWGLVLGEDVRWLHGLVLLDWLYNPRLSETGEVLEAEDDHAAAAIRLPKKLAVFDALWTTEGSLRFGRALPPGALQPLEGMLALPLLGPSGDFDPRYWQGFALQIAMAEVKAYAAGGSDAPPAKPPALPGSTQIGPPPNLAEEPPEDSITPLARAEQEAAADAAQRLTEGVVEPPRPAPVSDGRPAVRWQTSSRGPVLVVPADRFDAGLIRELRGGSVDDLPVSERPDASVFERWMTAGAPFVTELPLFSRLFLDNRPLYKGGFLNAASESEGMQALWCQLPRVAPVLAVLVPANGDVKRRILACSDRDRTPAEILALAP